MLCHFLPQQNPEQFDILELAYPGCPEIKTMLVLHLVKSLYERQKSNVRVAGGKSDWFNVLKGVRQGRVSTVSVPFQHHGRDSDAFGP